MRDDCRRSISMLLEDLVETLGELFRSAGTIADGIVA
jgi:hypothetical protein